MITQFLPDLHEFCVDELKSLSHAIDAYIQDYFACEEAFCKGEINEQELREAEIERGTSLKKQLAIVAISCGIHEDFLDNFIALHHKRKHKLIPGATGTDS